MGGTKSGDVEYIIRADDSQIESDLEQANRKVEKAVKKSADESVKTEEKKTASIKKENDKIVADAEKTANEVNSAWKSIDNDIDINVDADTSKAESEIKNISKNKSIKVDIEADNSDAKEAIEELEDFGEKTSKSLKEKLGEAFSSFADGDIGKMIGNIGGVAKESFSEAATSAVPFASALSGITSGLSASTVATVGIGAAFVGVGAIAVNAADNMKGAMNGFLSETGKSVEETERYQNVLEKIYSNNYGETFEDIASAMASVSKTMGEMDDASLQEITESAFALRDTFEYDITESTRAAKAMVDNFGISGAEAMGLIAAGAQNGLDYSGELLDSISEYSVQFAKVGLDANDMFNIFQKGAESGAFNLDKVGDAVKEMSIRVIDGSYTTREGFKLLGLDADEMSAKFAAGGDTAKEAFNQTLEALASIEDPIAQNTAGVDLMGTMWEDLGPTAVSALAGIEEGSYDAADAMNQIKEVKYDDLGSMLEALKRNVELLVIPIGNALIPLLSILISSVLPVLENLLGPLIQLFAELLIPMIEVVSSGINPLIDAMNFLISNAIEPLINIVSALLVPMFSGSLEGMFSSASSVIGNIINIFRNLLDFIKNVFTGNWSGAWSNIRNIFSEAVNALVSIFKAPMNAIVNGWNKLASSLGSVKAPDWVPIVGGKSFSLPKMSRLKVGLDYVPNDMFPAFLDEGEWVLTKEEARLLRSLGGIAGLQSLMKIPDVEFNNEGVKLNDIVREIIIHTHVDLDGKEVGNSITKYVDQNMSDDEELRRRGN